MQRDRTTLFVDVILPLAIQPLTYRVPHQFNNLISLGQRVVVPLGKSKLYTGLVFDIHQKAPTNYEAKYILEILDEQPIINQCNLKFWQWVSNYYLSSLGEVMTVALPSGLKLSSETKVLLNEAITIDKNQLTDREFLIVEALELKKKLSVQQIAQILNIKHIQPIVQKMADKQILITEEILKSQYKPKIEVFVKLHHSLENNTKRLEQVFKTLSKATKQQELLMWFLKLTQHNTLSITQSKLLSQSKSTLATLKALEKKEILKLESAETTRQNYAKDELAHFTLSIEQQKAFDEINLSFLKQPVTLLHGVTASGKTEIYIQLIKNVLEQGKQVLYLLPEIALTTQMIERLKRFFGNQIGVYHSRFNENERIETWYRVLGQNTKLEKCNIVLGARSALFLPFSNLGLIIVDEEHEQSFKQQDPSPRYHARDAAIVLAKNFDNCKVLLGTATPSIETFYNAQQQKFGYIQLNKRFETAPLPSIELVNLKEENKNKTMKSHFSSVLFKAIQDALGQKEQVILFQNRRGFSPFLECQDCQHVPYCKHCDVSLTYHKHINQLRCHYCGYSINPPSNCPQCHSTNIQFKGFGTEKVEDDITLFFPEAKVARMDLDSTRNKNAYARIIQDFSNRNIDILVGTQMLTKGLDFDNVSLVGVLNADALLHFPDYRAYEKAFQTLIQVSGRAGRKNKQGKVIIQTYQPEHFILKAVEQHNYQAMYETQLQERLQFKYPPFYRLIKLTLKHPDEQYLEEAAKYFGKLLRQTFTKQLLGPESPLVKKINNLYLKDCLLKLDPNTTNVKKAKEALMYYINSFKSNPLGKNIRINIDVDVY